MKTVRRDGFPRRTALLLLLGTNERTEKAVADVMFVVIALAVSVLDFVQAAACSVRPGFRTAFWQWRRYRLRC